MMNHGAEQNGKASPASAFLASFQNSLRTPAGLFRSCPIQWSKSDQPAAIESETQAVLRTRLRAASFILFLGFAVFLEIYWLNDLSWRASVFWIHVAVAVVMGLCTVVLCERYGWGLRQLRGFEYVVFGIPVAFLTYLQFLQAEAYAANCGQTGRTDLMVALESELVIPWICLMFIYASFIPNTWQRAAAHIAPMVLIPIGVFVWACLQHQCSTPLLYGRPMVFMVLWLVMASVASTFGTYTYSALRSRAALARELGSYHLKQRIGEGGMGEVYLGEHKMLKRPCAIKLIHPHKAADPKALARFETEVQATARLTHWNTVEIFDYGHTEDGTFYYAMEYLPGMSLQDLVDRHGPIPTERAIHLLRQVCEGLREAHAMGLIHRDIKPGNIFASHRGGYWDVAKLLDFGLVKSIAPTSEPSVTQSTDGIVVGTPLFASPEWTLADGQLDERSDIYSLGAVGYFLVTGRPVFLHKSAMKLLFAHANEPVTPLRSVQPDVPADFESVILRCLAKRPEDRFHSVRDLKEALDRCELSDAWTQDQAVEWWGAIETTSMAFPRGDSDPSAVTQILEVVERAGVD